MKKDKIIFWFGIDFTQYCISYYFEKNYDSENYAIIDVTNQTKNFFKKQELVKLKKFWFIHDQYEYNFKKPDIEYLKNFEEKYKINLWQLAFNERIFYGFFDFHKFSNDEILYIVEKICRFYEKILDEIEPDYFITKLTTFHHLELFRRMCISKGVKVLMLSNPKIPKKIIISEDDTKIDYENSLDKYSPKHFSFEEVRDFYNHLSSNAKAKELVQKFWKNHGSSSILKTITIFILFLLSKSKNEKTNYNYYGMSKWNILKKFLILRIKKKIRENFINKYFLTEIPQNINYVFFPLSVVLERHILIGAPYSINQIELVKNIAKSLPVNYNLVIKEHPAQSSREWRTISEYKDLLKVPNTIVMHPSSNDEILIKNSSLIITTAGSIGFQSSLYGKPCLVFGDVIYSYLPSVKKIMSLETLPQLIRDSLKIKPIPEDVSKYLQMLDHNSIDFDFLQFTSLFSHEFFFDGGYNDMFVNQNMLEKFIVKNKNILLPLTMEHIKKINQHKNRKSIS